jgi:hypothetical protein
MIKWSTKRFIVIEPVSFCEDLHKRNFMVMRLAFQPSNS